MVSSSHSAQPSLSSPSPSLSSPSPLPPSIPLSTFTSPVSTAVSPTRRALSSPLPPPAAVRLREVLSGTRTARVLILSSDTGGGHRASAAALSAALHHLYPGRLRVHTVDFWVEFARGGFRAFPSNYAFLAKHPFLWRASYHATRFPPLRGATEVAFNLFAHANVRKAFVDFAPDLIVSVHPLVNTLSMRVLKALRRDAAAPGPVYVTVVTDLGGAHPTWFHPGADMTYVPTDAVARIAASCGIREDRLRLFGLPVRKDFWGEEPGATGATGKEDREEENIAAAACDKHALRKKLGMRSEAKAFLLVGGGDGVGNLGAVAKSIAAKLFRDHGADATQMVVVCGKNEVLKTQLERHVWNIPVLVRGFVDNMFEWMSAADALVTKAGPGTIAEGLICGLPILISGFLPGQEEANVRYVVEKGCGEYASRPVKIAAIASRWVQRDGEALKEMGAAALREARPQAPLQIARDIWDVASAKMADNAALLEHRQRVRAAQTAMARNQVFGAAARAVVGGPGGGVVSTNQSHLLMRVKVLLRIVFGGVIAAEATNIHLPHMPVRIRN